MSQQQPILSNEEQYRAELAALPRLSVAEQRIAVERARRGDREAAEQLILHCLRTVERIAYRLSMTYLPGGYLDLVQVGNLALVSHVERVLDKAVPASYLCGVARREMRSYAFYHSRLIDVPERTEALHVAPTTVSYESASVLAELVTDLQGGEQAGFTATYGALYEALSTLTDKQREIVSSHHGIDGEAESLEAIARRQGVTSQTVGQQYHAGIKRLRRYFKLA